MLRECRATPGRKKGVAWTSQPTPPLSVRSLVTAAPSTRRSLASFCTPGVLRCGTPEPRCHRPDPSLTQSEISRPCCCAVGTGLRFHRPAERIDRRSQELSAHPQCTFRIAAGRAASRWSRGTPAGSTGSIPPARSVIWSNRWARLVPAELVWITVKKRCGIAAGESSRSFGNLRIRCGLWGIQSRPAAPFRRQVSAAMARSRAVLPAQRCLPRRSAPSALRRVRKSPIRSIALRMFSSELA